MLCAFAQLIYQLLCLFLEENIVKIKISASHSSQFVKSTWPISNFKV